MLELLYPFLLDLVLPSVELYGIAFSRNNVATYKIEFSLISCNIYYVCDNWLIKDVQFNVVVV